MKTLKKFLNQRGQTAVFFALLLPVIILFLFVVFDLGWLYINKSRLQNAAEAAAIAGANRYCEVSQDGYNNVMLIYKITSEGNQLSVTKSPDEINNAAKSSWSDNLGFSADSATDSWTKADVTPNYKIYEDKTNGKVYYEVELSEEVGHIFKVLDNVISTKVPAVAVAEITKIGERNLFDDMVALDTTHTIGNWEEQNGARTKINSDKNKYKEDDFTFYSYPERRNRYYYDGVWNHYQDAAPTRSKVHYTAGNVYKYETITINPTNSERDTARGTSANGNKVNDASLVDSLNLDFRQDVALNFNGILTADWDIGFDLTGTGINSVGVLDSNSRDGWGTNEINLRVHATFNFDEAFITRTLSAAQKAKVDKRYANAFNETGITGPDADPLYVRIESEPMLSELSEKAGIMKQLNSVRQIILNFNETNMDTADDEKNHDYKYRPYVILYDGPEKVDLNSKRESQPVIVNLNADFRGILFMPNSPVVINGNNHKFQGFVIAKEFRKLKTESDYAYHYKRDGDNKDIYFDNKNAPTAEPASDGNFIMVKKNDGTSTDWFKVDKSKLLYTSEYAKITVEDSVTNAKNPNYTPTDNAEDKSAYTFTYTKKDYAVKRFKVSDGSFKDAGNYYTENEYYDSSTMAAPAYVKHGLTLGEFEGATLNSNNKWEGGTLKPSDANIIVGRRDQWWEAKKSNEKVWSIFIDWKSTQVNNVNPTNDNCLFYKYGWRLITDENGNKKIAQITTKTNNTDDYINLNNYVEVIDAEGKTAYTHKDNVKSTNEVYLKLTNAKTEDIIYINKNNKNYYIKKSDAEPLILDLNGTVQYTKPFFIDTNGVVKFEGENATPYEYEEATNATKLDDRGKSPSFTPKTFNLATAKTDTHYSRCGAVPKRIRYSVLDAFEEDGDYCQDMFFTTARSKYVI